MRRLADHGIDQGAANFVEVDPNEPNMKPGAHLEDTKQQLRPLIELLDVIGDLSLSDLRRRRIEDVHRPRIRKPFGPAIGGVLSLDRAKKVTVALEPDIFPRGSSGS